MESKKYFQYEESGLHALVHLIREWLSSIALKTDKGSEKRKKLEIVQKILTEVEAIASFYSEGKEPDVFDMASIGLKAFTIKNLFSELNNQTVKDSEEKQEMDFTEVLFYRIRNILDADDFDTLKDKFLVFLGQYDSLDQITGFLNTKFLLSELPQTINYYFLVTLELLMGKRRYAYSTLEQYTYDDARKCAASVIIGEKRAAFFGKYRKIIKVDREEKANSIQENLDSLMLRISALHSLNGDLDLFISMLNELKLTPCVLKGDHCRLAEMIKLISEHKMEFINEYLSLIEQRLLSVGLSEIISFFQKQKITDSDLLLKMRVLKIKLIERSFLELNGVDFSSMDQSGLIAHLKTLKHAVACIHDDVGEVEFLQEAKRKITEIEQILSGQCSDVVLSSIQDGMKSNILSFEDEINRIKEDNRTKCDCVEDKLYFFEILRKDVSYSYQQKIDIVLEDPLFQAEEKILVSDAKVDNVDFFDKLSREVEIHFEKSEKINFKQADELSIFYSKDQKEKLDRCKKEEAMILIDFGQTKALHKACKEMIINLIKEQKQRIHCENYLNYAIKLYEEKYHRVLEGLEFIKPLYDRIDQLNKSLESLSKMRKILHDFSGLESNDSYVLDKITTAQRLREELSSCDISNEQLVKFKGALLEKINLQISSLSLLRINGAYDAVCSALGNFYFYDEKAEMDDSRVTEINFSTFNESDLGAQIDALHDVKELPCFDQFDKREDVDKKIRWLKAIRQNKLHYDANIKSLDDFLIINNDNMSSWMIHSLPSGHPASERAQKVIALGELIRKMHHKGSDMIIEAGQNNVHPRYVDGASFQRIAVALAGEVNQFVRGDLTEQNLATNITARLNPETYHDVKNIRHYRPFKMLVAQIGLALVTLTGSVFYQLGLYAAFKMGFASTPCLFWNTARENLIDDVKRETRCFISSR